MLLSLWCCAYSYTYRPFTRIILHLLTHHHTHRCSLFFRLNFCFQFLFLNAPPRGTPPNSAPPEGAPPEGIPPFIVLMVHCSIFFHFVSPFDVPILVDLPHQSISVLHESRCWKAFCHHICNVFGRLYVSDGY